MRMLLVTLLFSVCSSFSDIGRPWTPLDQTLHTTNKRDPFFFFLLMSKWWLYLWSNQIGLRSDLTRFWINWDPMWFLDTKVWSFRQKKSSWIRVLIRACSILAMELCSFFKRKNTHKPMYVFQVLIKFLNFIN